MESLRDLRIATVGGTVGEELARRYSRRLLMTGSLEEAAARLTDDAAEAVVFDMPQLEHYLATHASMPLAVIDTQLSRQHYGFAFPINSPLRRQVNLDLLALSESGRIEEISNHCRGTRAVARPAPQVGRAVSAKATGLQ